MKSFKKLAYIADKFEAKIKRAQQLTGEDPKAVTADAFFNPKGNKDESEFQSAILTGGSAFMSALPEQVKKCSIGAAVDVPGKMADFLVKTVPPVSAQVITQLKDALTKDYTRFYGKAPSARVVEKSTTVVQGKPLVSPTLKISHPEIIVVT